jgi:hypothetical protein
MCAPLCIAQTTNGRTEAASIGHVVPAIHTAHAATAEEIDVKPPRVWQPSVSAYISLTRLHSPVRRLLLIVKIVKCQKLDRRCAEFTPVGEMGLTVSIIFANLFRFSG